MRSRFFAVACLCLACALAGCSVLPVSRQNTPTPEPTQEVVVTPSPTPTPAPTPSPTPVPVVAVEDTVYEAVKNKTMGIQFEVPSHWVNVPGRSTISYEEPVEAGNLPARIALSSRKLSKAPSGKKYKNEMEIFMDALKSGYEAFETEKLNTKAKILGTNGVSQVYTAQGAAGRIKGHVVIVHLKAKQRLYAVHFSAPEDRFEALEGIAQRLRSSLKALK